MKIINYQKYKEFSVFYWIVLVTILCSLSIFIYKSTKIEQTKQVRSSLNNIYFQKTIKELVQSLQPRYTDKVYTSKAGDTYQSIINNLKIDKKEKELLLNTILKEKSLKILRINQKFSFKFDNLSSQKIIEFKIETDKKKWARVWRMYGKSK